MGILDRVLNSKPEPNPPLPGGFKVGDLVSFDKCTFKLDKLVPNYKDVWSGRCTDNSANGGYWKNSLYWLHEVDITLIGTHSNTYYVLGADREYPNIIRIAYYIDNNQNWYVVASTGKSTKSVNAKSVFENLMASGKLLVIDPWPQWLVDFDATR